MEDHRAYLYRNEPERGETLIRWVADRLGIAYACWEPDAGLSRSDLPSFRMPVPASMMIGLPFLGRTSTHEVLPP